MTPSALLLGLYQELQQLHTQMAANAVCQRFIELPGQQAQADALVARIQAIPAAPLPAELRLMISGLIKTILADQKLIKTEIADWQSDIQPLLESFDAYPPGK